METKSLKQMILDLNFKNDCKLGDLPPLTHVRLYKKNGQLILIDYQVEAFGNTVEMDGDKIRLTNTNTLNSRLIHKDVIVKCEELNFNAVIRIKALTENN